VLPLRSLVLFNKAIEHDNCPIVYRLHDTKATDASWQVALFFIMATSAALAQPLNFKLVRCAIRDGMHQCRFSFPRLSSKLLLLPTQSEANYDSRTNFPLLRIDRIGN
jgi:hypothetical protein